MPEFGGKYNSFTQGNKNFINKSEYRKMVTEHKILKDMSADKYLNSAGISNDLPFGRGCYVSRDKEFIIWVGEEDHLRIMCMKKGFILNDVFDRLKHSLDIINSIEGLKFAISPDYGAVTSCPTNLGTGMKPLVHIPIPNLTKGGSYKKVEEISKPFGLSVMLLAGKNTPIGLGGICEISPTSTFCITESLIIAKLYHGIKSIKEAEENHKKFE